MPRPIQPHNSYANLQLDGRVSITTHSPLEDRARRAAGVHKPFQVTFGYIRFHSVTGVREPFSAVRLLAETIGAEELLRCYGVSRQVFPAIRCRKIAC